MTPRRAVYAIAFVFIPALITGCLDVETTTTVNRDGSMRRAYGITGDSAAVYGGRYTVALDSTWSHSIRNVGDQKFELTATKAFANAEALSAEAKGTPDQTLMFTVSLDESFRWFTSLLTYRETVHRFQPINEVPITDYISQSEIDRFIAHEVLKEPYATAGDSLSLDDASDRFEEWNSRNIFAAYYRIFLDGVRELDDANLSTDYVESRKDTLYAVFSHIDAKQEDAQRRAFENLLDRKGVREVYRIKSTEFDHLAQQLEFVDEVSANTYRTSVMMPGIIVDTNAPSLEGNRAEWKDYMGVAYVRDFEMWVTSEVVNWWAIIVTAVLILGGFALLVLAPIRRRSRRPA